MPFNAQTLTTKKNLYKGSGQVKTLWVEYTEAH